MRAAIEVEMMMRVQSRIREEGTEGFLDEVSELGLWMTRICIAVQVYFHTSLAKIRA